MPTILYDDEQTCSYEGTNTGLPEPHRDEYFLPALQTGKAVDCSSSVYNKANNGKDMSVNEFFAKVNKTYGRNGGRTPWSAPGEVSAEVR
jgi:hypothetical protein